MPIYEFICKSCGKEQEQLVRTASQDSLCEQCGSSSLLRKLSTFSVSKVPEMGKIGKNQCACGRADDSCQNTTLY